MATPTARARAAATCAATTILMLALYAGCQGRPRGEPAPSPTPAASGSVAWVPERPRVGRSHVAELNLRDGLPEVYRRGLFAPATKRSFVEFMRLLEDIAAGRDKDVRGVFVLLGSTQLGVARTEEVVRGLARIRQANVPVICHADEYGNASYWLAAAGCDRIWVSPAGGVDTVGLAAELVFAQRLLSELKVDVQMMQIGRYKGAAEPFTRTSPSEEAKESLLGVLRSIRGTWLGGIEQARKGDALPAAAEQGPYAPQKARELGLVDAVGYAENARAEAIERAEVDQSVPRFGRSAAEAEAGGLVELVRILSGAGPGPGTARVTVLRATGAIAMEPSGSLLLESDGISERVMAHELDKLRRDDATRAVVLRIDSPGGSALASDLLWHRLMELRKVKPVVVSVGDMAASGGYYLACAGSRIFAEKTSIVGSIGVVGGKFAIPRALDHIGINTAIVPASPEPGAEQRAAYLSPLTSWNEETEQRVRASMQSVYDLFLDRVAQGRGLPVEQVAGFAEGRIFAGTEAHGLKMVDELGGILEAIDAARGMAGLAPDAPVAIVGEESGLERLLDLQSTEAEEGEAKLLQPACPSLTTMASRAQPHLGRFVGAFAPMMQGERTLAAVPFAFVVR